jgi:hypothetical protein
VLHAATLRRAFILCSAASAVLYGCRRPEHREAVERALRVHPEGCPAHQSVKDAISVTWSATLHSGDEVTQLHEADLGQ